MKYPARRGLDNTARVPDDDECRSPVEEHNVILPADLRTSSGAVFAETFVPDAGNDDEEGENEDLENETSKDDVFS